MKPFLHKALKKSHWKFRQVAIKTCNIKIKQTPSTLRLSYPIPEKEAVVDKDSDGAGEAMDTEGEEDFRGKVEEPP